MKFNSSYKVVCPFYKSHIKGEIHCEGIEGELTATHIVFLDGIKQREAYMKKFCFKLMNYENCRVADMLLLKHEYLKNGDKFDSGGISKIDKNDRE